MKEFSTMVDSDRLIIAEKAFESSAYVQGDYVARLIAQKQQMEANKVPVSVEFERNLEKNRLINDLLMEWCETIRNARKKMMNE